MSASQQVILDALMIAVDEAIADGKLSETVYAYEPKSHVFFPEDGEVWDEDDVAAIRAVGEQDVAAKIKYWSDVLDRLDERERAADADEDGEADDE